MAFTGPNRGRIGFGSFRLPDFNISETLFGRGFRSPQNSFQARVGDFGGQNSPGSFQRASQTVRKPIGPQPASFAQRFAQPGRVSQPGFATAGGRTAQAPPTPPQPPTPTQAVTPGGEFSPADKALLAKSVQEGRNENLSDAERISAERSLESELLTRQQEVESVFGPQENFLASLLAQARGGEQGNLDVISGRFSSQIPGLQSARDSLLGRVEQRRGDTQRREQTAIGEARRLANELSLRNTQQFGGGSAGQFAQEFQGRELQRGLGGIRQTATGNLQQLGQQSQDIEANFQNSITQLEAQKQSALAEARNRFQDRVSQIQGQQAGLASEKAAALNDAARELRAEQFNIEQTDASFRQGLVDQFTQVALQLAANQQQSLAEAGQPIDLQAIQDAILPTIQGFQQAISGPQIQGQVRRREEDELTPDNVITNNLVDQGALPQNQRETFSQ